MQLIMKKTGIIIFTIGLILALALGGFAIYVGAQNNNQGEFYDFQTGVWNISYSLTWLLSPLIIWLVIFFSGYGIYKLYKHGEKMAMK